MPLAHIHEQIVFLQLSLKNRTNLPQKDVPSLANHLYNLSNKRIPLAVLGSNRHSTPFNIQELFRSLLYFF